MQLARYDNPDIRHALAENHQIDNSILSILAKDQNPLVAGRATKNFIAPQTSNSYETRYLRTPMLSIRKPGS